MGLPLRSPVAKLSCEAATEENAKRRSFMPRTQVTGKATNQDLVQSLSAIRSTHDVSIDKEHRSWNLLKLTHCLRHQEPSEMILFLLFQRRVLFHGWLHCFSPWFAKIHFETCCDIRF